MGGQCVARDDGRGYRFGKEFCGYAASTFTDSLLQANPDYNPCADRWKNMKDEITKKMWGIFDETGIFLSLCRHGFSLVIADMVQSGEL